MTLMKLRLDFLLTDLSQHFRIYLFNGLLYSSFLFMGIFIRSDVQKVICVVKLKVAQLQPKYKIRNLPNLGTINKKVSSSLADFSPKGVAGLGESIKNENL